MQTQSSPFLFMLETFAQSDSNQRLQSNGVFERGKKANQQIIAKSIWLWEIVQKLYHMW